MRKRSAQAHSSFAAGELKHFTNRETEQAAFRELVDRPAGGLLPVLYFYAVGGNGKSWLMRKLRESLDEHEGGPIPSARLDFDPKMGGMPYHHDSSFALGEIRRQLDVDCPRFDLAYAMMRFKQGAGDEPLLKRTGKAHMAWDLVDQLGQATLGNAVPGGNLIVWAASRLGAMAGAKLKDTAIGKWMLSDAGSDDFYELKRMTTQEIHPLLAERLGRDLEDQLPPRPGKACQAVVFLDTFEALQVGIQSEAHQHDREAWVRELYENLVNVLLVIAGRDRLTWDQVDPDWALAEHLQSFPIAGLSRRDAEAFLERCGVKPGPLRDAVLRACADREIPREGSTLGMQGYHPFSLGLCADTIANERALGREPAPGTFALSAGDASALAQRFLKSLPDRTHEVWVTSLAQTPRFDETAARALFSPVADAHQNAAWVRLCDFSLMRETPEAGWYTLHPRMVDALRQRLAAQPGALRREHERWRDHWQSRSQSEYDAYAALAWYHALQLEPEHAVGDWKVMVKLAREERQMAQHYELLEWWTPTGIETREPRDSWSAGALFNLGVELAEATLGNRARNLRRAIACYQAVITVYTEQTTPINWARVQNNLGLAYANLPTGDRSENLRNAIACYNAALLVYTEESFPMDWATIQNNLGSAHYDMPTGDRAQNLQKAIGYFQAALRVRTESDLPLYWAMTQNNLGTAYAELPTGDRAQNLQNTIACFEAVLRIYSEHDRPTVWATVQNNLGAAYYNLPTGDRTEYLKHAIACYQAALRVRTETDFPLQWAKTQNNLGTAFADLPPDESGENLRNAIGCFRAALRVYCEDDFPNDWARAQNNLGTAYADLPSGDRAENLRQAIACYQSALHVRTERNSPLQWATTQNNLGTAYLELPAGDRTENLKNAIACHRAALRVYTEDDFPIQWAMTQENLGTALLASGSTDAAHQAFQAAARGYRAAGLEDEAIEAESRAQGR